MIRLAVIWIVSRYLFLFCRHRVYGKCHFPKGSAIICANHNSFLDPPVIGCSAPGEVHFLGRDTLFQVPLFGWLIRQLNTHPVRRGKGNSSAFKKTIELLQQGCKVVIFPEGTRSPDGELRPGQLGVAMLVQKMYRAPANSVAYQGIPVVPVYIEGTYEMWSIHRRLPKLFGKTACVFGSPMTFEELFAQEGDKKEVQEAIRARIMEKIAQLKTWYAAGAHGTPP